MAFVIASKDPAVALAEALAVYKEETGVTLAPGDPRRLHLQTLLLLVSQLRESIDFAGKQALLDYVSDEFIEDLGQLIGVPRRGAGAAEYPQRFTRDSGYAGPWTVAAGRKVTDGTHIFEVVATVLGTVSDTYVDATVRCTTTGTAGNGLTAGQIDTLYEPIDHVASTANTGTESTLGSDAESLSSYRERLRTAPEDASAGGPRAAYEALAKAASSSVADAVCCGPDDGSDMNGSAPSVGNVKVFIIQGTRDANGELTAVNPEPSSDLVTLVQAALDDDNDRPLCDTVTVAAPSYVDSTPDVTYYVTRSQADSITEIQDAVEAAFDAYCFWQESKIGRDINPSKIYELLMAAGAKRLTFTTPSFVAIKKDQCARMVYPVLTYGGLEDE